MSELGEQCSTFTAKVGVGDEVGAADSVTFEVRGDGKVLATSGVEQLQLVVTDTVDGKSSDHADWGSPVLTCSTSQPTITLDQSALSIFHKHRGAVQATFKNISGPVNLRLEPLNGPLSGTRLETTSAVVSSSGTSSSGTTRTLKISAPIVPVNVNQPTDLIVSYLLVASQIGVEVARAPITISERLLCVSVTLLPDTLTVDPTVTTTMSSTVKATMSPPLDAPVPVPVPVTIGFPYDDFGRMLTAVGATHGDGATMYQDHQITFPSTQDSGQESTGLMTYAPDFLGHRLLGYNSHFEQLFVTYK